MKQDDRNVDVDLSNPDAEIAGHLDLRKGLAQGRAADFLYYTVA